MRVLGALLLLTAACTSVPEISPQPGGLIGYLDEAGNVAVVLPDGTGSRKLTTDASEEIIYQQPTWSRRDHRLAWTAIRRSDGPIDTSVLIAPAEGTAGVQRVPTPTAPFYFSWSPDGRALAALGSGSETIDLLVIDPGLGEVRTASSGQPYYFAWSPDSSRMIAHIGNERVTLLFPDDRIELISEGSDAFQAPGWSSRDELAYVVGSSGVVAGPATAQSSGEKRLIITDVSRAAVTVVESFEGVISFSFSPNGERIAYSVSSLDARARTGVNFGPLVVAGLDDLSVSQVDSDPVVLYQWSPTGESLLYAVVSGSGNEIRLLWRIWRSDPPTPTTQANQPNQPTTEYASFRPTIPFAAAYLPFWDQYALSSRLWSPDGSAFVYTDSGDGTDRILVQELDRAAPEQIALGSVAFWSP